ncbi:glucuronate isomerase [Echinicola strongylocentroti]|uniref:Uronate isomerase n=1 Tax=Echinicola strongylocentroti TaxID=1795355 RepID=A0A2Z4IP40_9BACT|nr:glucuronate isomerase [Echinicola strongylocentroti]AWW32665.1 glucuronate isomerase [Echinicola strongylocentroti]
MHTPEPKVKSTFIQEDFLLQSKMASVLYHDYAKKMPIIDYHCHLSPKDLAENRKFENTSQIWLAGDHYKWRAMRTLGIKEDYITGNASDQEKFEKWAYTVPYTMRNPLYHWTHLELLRYFDIDELLSADNATAIYQATTDQLQKDSHSAQSLLTSMEVETVCTTDDPIDSLEYHKMASDKGMPIGLFPTFRPDKSFAVEQPAVYNAYLEKLAAASNMTIDSHEQLIAALENRVAFFHENGGRLADHGLEQLYHFPIGTFDIEVLFKKVTAGKPLDTEETAYYKFITLLELCRLYHAKGWTQQFHLGALRNTNERMLNTLGPDTGFDSIGDFSQAKALSLFLNELDKTDQLCKTILYNLNPRDNEVMATMTGNFNDGSIRGKVQFGSGWWYMDQKDGMEKQMNTLSNMGLLSCFVGMLTDSRSFLSFPRHEYFRRTLCNLIGNDVANGELPADEKWLGKMVQDICYYNAKNYFNFQ